LSPRRKPDRSPAAVGWLPDHHGDPFDRLLIAQASVEAATIITRDPVIAGYDVTTAWRRPVTS